MTYELSYGKHESPEDGRCAMEWVAYIAGEGHTDAPKCVSLALRHFTMNLNDCMSREWRQKLRPYLARMIGTADDGLDVRRRFEIAQWAADLAASVGVPDLAASVGVPDDYLHDVTAMTSYAPMMAGYAVNHGAPDFVVWKSALDLLDRLLPTETIDMPTEVSERAVEVCA